MQALIDSEGLSSYHWLTLVLCFLIVAVDGFDTAVMGYVAPALVEDWGVEKSSLGPVLSAALFGLVGGALVAGPIADRIGRKKILVLSVTFFGVFSLATAFAQTLNTLVILRFFTGIGLGAEMPNAVTLVSEFVPVRKRSVLVNAMFCGFPLGSAAGGFLAAWMIPHFGWQSVLVLGGVAPLILTPLLLILLPESLRFMVLRNYPTEQIRKVLARAISVSLGAVDKFIVQEAAEQEGSAIRTVLSPRYRAGTLMLWLAYFMGLVILFLLSSWMPLLMKEAGLSLQHASLLTALFPLGGGIGAIVAGWFMDRFNPNKVVAIGYTLTGVFVYSVGHGIGNQIMLGVLIFLAGTTMNGSQVSMPSLAANFYPTQGRATGVSWMLGIGRFGGIAGTLLGAELLLLKLDFSTIFALMMIPAAIAAVALLVKSLSEGKRVAETQRAPVSEVVSNH
ncbi:4-hydroxybenzoate transporter [Burkholderia pseudomallei MSHR338]|nr:4-hydroxybenzoate transporter [Burkholderia pseudomallei MSHR338]